MKKGTVFRSRRHIRYQLKSAQLKMSGLYPLLSSLNRPSSDPGICTFFVVRIFLLFALVLVVFFIAFWKDFRHIVSVI